jgi:hypothetical protein
MANQNVGQLFFTLPHGMAIMPHVVHGQWLIMFSYKDVPKLKAFTAELAEKASRVTANVERHVLAPKSTKCPHPEKKRHISDKGVFCLECNEPLLPVLEPTGFSKQESPVVTTVEKEEETEEEQETVPDTVRPLEKTHCPYCGSALDKGECPNGHSQTK